MEGVENRIRTSCIAEGKREGWRRTNTANSSIHEVWLGLGSRCMDALHVTCTHTPTFTLHFDSVVSVFKSWDGNESVEGGDW